jgi:diguanylate cyclase (GGDEF)-like protein
VIILALLLDRQFFTKKQLVPSHATTMQLMISYLLYLIFTIISHLVINQYVVVPVSLGKVIILIHLVTFPALLLHWMTVLNRQLMLPNVYHTLTIVQIVSFSILLMLFGIDLITPRWIILDEKLHIVGDFGLYLLLLVGGFYTLVTMGAYFRYRIQHHHDRLAFSGLVPIVMLVSLVQFVVSKHHDVFTISGAFLLLLHHLTDQHQQQELDELTKVPDQYSFLHYCTDVLSRGDIATLMIIDCENFRFITKQFGIKTGNDLLKQLVEFYALLAPQSLIFRIGGNRFALSVPYQSHNDLVRLVHRVQERMKSLWFVPPYTISLHVNIGFLQIPVHARSRENILDAIEFLFSEMSEKKRQSVLIYNQRLIQQRQRQQDILTALRAVKTAPERVIVYYQPIYSVTRNRIIGAEALMRIQDPLLGMLMPGEFIPAAEKAGLIGNLTEIMVSHVCQFLVNCGDRFSFLQYVSINISAEDFSSLEKAHRLLTQIQKSTVDPHKLCIEMTESAVFKTFSTVKDIWEQLADLGVSFALDDFGTGYANLETLVNVPFDVVKIDRSVVSHSRNNFELVNLIALVLERLQKPMIAEGIETREQLEFIQAAGIDMVQGYYFSRPIPESQFLDLLQFEKQK